MNQNLYSPKAIKRALHTYISFKIANLLLAFMFQVAVAKLLLPSDFATYAVLLATLMAGERALSFGIDRTILRFVPALTRSGNIVALRALLSRIAIMRLAALMILVPVGYFGARWINSIVPVRLGDQTMWAFSVWFVAYTLMADTDAFAQSWLAHFDTALASTVEIVARMILLIIFSHFHPPEVQDIVNICAATSAAAAILLILRLCRFAKPFITGARTGSRSMDDAAFNPKRAPMFAFANFASTMSYLISSPPVIRIMATAGLDVIALAAFSFAQGLSISIQRVFPGLLIIPTIEPIIMSQLAGDLKGDRAFANLALLYKAELCCILVVVIATSVAGADIVEILSRPIYAPYYYVLPLLVGSLALITSYRLFELVANSNSKQHLFFWLWPLSVLAMVGMYGTVRSWGLMSVLLWPIAEIAVRICVLAFFLRRYAVWRAFDPARALQLIVCAGVIAVGALQLRPMVPLHILHSDLMLAAASVALFLASLFALRPLQQLEYEALVTAIPESWGIVRTIASLVTRRSMLRYT